LVENNPLLIEVVLFPGGDGLRDSNQAAWGMKSQIAVDLNAVQLIQQSTAEEYQVLPIAIQGQVLLVALAEIQNQAAIAAIIGETGFRIRPVQADPQVLRDAIPRLYACIVQTPRQPLGQLLLQNQLITVDQLNNALEVQKHSGDRLGQIVVSHGYINRLALAEALAEQEHMPMVNLRTIKIDPAISHLLDDETVRKWQSLPVRRVGDFLQVAIVDPTREDIKADLRKRLGVPLVFAVTSEFDINWALDNIYRATYLEDSIAGLLYRNADESAFVTFTNLQLVTVYGFLLLVILFLGFFPLQFIIAINLLAGIYYLATSVYRVFLAVRSNSEDLTIPISEEEIRALKDSDLPVYTVMIPVFHEKDVLSDLIKSIDAMDYPKEKLDVKLLFEESDHETLAFARTLHPPGYIEFLVVPDAIPRTKPKALNYGLVAAKGTYVVVYDAEDAPEKDQLKKAVIAFRKADADIICLQAKLNYYNMHQNLLTRWFTIEYSMWFDHMLPGLDAIKVPIPLGGTSNHFITEKIRELGAWDPFNVTEDADLGIRMFKRHFRTAIIESTTFEEANSDLWNWIRQRTRWVKGYMQTWLVCMRHPVSLYKSLGLKAFISFQLTIGGAFILLLVNPIYWMITSIWFLGHWNVIPDLFPGLIFYLSMFNLVTGNFLFLYLNMIGPFRRGYYDLTKYALISPIYWVFMSLASWRAVWQLLTRPFYWEKTVHGLHTIPLQKNLRTLLTNRFSGKGAR
jgi:cellulose synthase/poly-beta-1,6-N-acetylglucosamine synthase-like glycosyltransferase